MRNILADRKGFTLAELLVVVAVIAVLVAIAIPVFSSQAAAAKEATDEANCRSAKASATVICLSDYGGNFSQLTTAEWVQRVIAEGAPEYGQVDPQATLNCTIDNNSITFFYGDAPSGGDGGTTPSGPAAGVTVTDSQGTTHEVRVSGSWADILQQAADSGWNGVTVPSGSVFSDETGVYAVGWNGSLSGITGKTLAQVYNEGGSSLIKIDDSTKIWTSADISEGRWTGTPTSGDLIYINGQYKIVPAGASIGEWDVSAGAAVTLVQP